MEDEGPKWLWPLGIIMGTISGSDRLVRSVQVKTKRDIITRPIQRMRDLEVSIEATDPAPPYSVPPVAEINRQSGSEGHEDEPLPSTEQTVVDASESPTTRRGRTVKAPDKLDL